MSTPSSSLPPASPAFAGPLLKWVLGLSLGTKLYVLLLAAALPLCAVTGYQARSALMSSREVAREFPAFDLAVRRDARYKVFMDGVSDAVDSGTLSQKAVKALQEARSLSNQLESVAAVITPELDADLRLIITAVSQDRALQALLPLREEVQRSSKAIVASAEGHHRRLDEIVSDSIRASHRDTVIALATVAVSMLLACWLGGSLIRHIVRVEGRAHEASALNQAIMDAAPIGMMTIDADAVIATANRACHVMHGYQPGELLGCLAGVLADTEELERRRRDLELESGHGTSVPGGLFLPSQVAGGDITEAEWHCVRKDGSRFAAGVIDLPLHNAAGFSLGSLRMVMDITERKRAAARVEHMALHDSLTGLPNRLQLQARAASAITRARREQGRLALALIDLDRFKPINDSLGHAIGDEVLKIVAQRLTDAVRSSDLVVRMGGDEFAVLLPDLQKLEHAVEVGQKIRTAMAEVMVVENHRLQVSASVGIAFYPQHGTDLTTLIRNADAAMYDAKSRGRDSVSLYDEGMSLQAVNESERRVDLRLALDRGEFVLHYQPLVDALTGRVRALEALVRWQHPHHGLLAPGEFITLAEETGLIVPIGAWVLRQACADLSELRRCGHPALRMAVNVSPRQFMVDGLENDVEAALNAAGLEGAALELEITETVLMNSVNRTQAILAALRARGVRVAIDDFGTGYSSLSYLAHFPVQTVKVDRSFVHQIDSGHGTALVAGAIVSMARSLGLEVVAEGVETPEQHARLVALGCGLLQGFRFSRPVPLEELPAAISRVQALPQLQAAAAFASRAGEVAAAH